MGTIRLHSFCTRAITFRSFIKRLHSHDTGTAVAQWLKRCATNRKAAGSIPDGVIGIFQ